MSIQWKNASRDDQNRLKVSEIILERYPSLLDQIFHPTEPSLINSPQAILKGRSQGEKILMGLCIDLWNEGVGVKVMDLGTLDYENLQNVFSALTLLRAK